MLTTLARRAVSTDQGRTRRRGMQTFGWMAIGGLAVYTTTRVLETPNLSNILGVVWVLVLVVALVMGHK